MSDVKPEPISGETGTIGAGSAAPEMSTASVPEAAAEVEFATAGGRARRNLAQT